MDLVLKQFDDILLHFTAKRTIDGIDVAITSTNKDKATYLPLGMKPTNESLTRWLRHRTIPANRAYAQNFLSKNGLSENDFIGILLTTLTAPHNSAQWAVVCGLSRCGNT